jgi:hypothetical protein
MIPMLYPYPINMDPDAIMYLLVVHRLEWEPDDVACIGIVTIHLPFDGQADVHQATIVPGERPKRLLKRLLGENKLEKYHVRIV